MNHNPLLKLQEYGQSIWLDYLRRNLITSGELQQLIENDGLRGVTSNPSIFEKAIDGSDDYTSAIHALAHQKKSADDIYLDLVISDIQMAADAFRETYVQQDGHDGYVSLEVSPLLARDTEATINEARRLWKLVDRPNVMIKVPGTKEGLPAIRRLISEGINVNVTLLFGLERYREVIDAYLSGLEDRVGNGQPINNVFSVASFFLSRIDVKIDELLDAIIRSNREDAKTAHGLLGQVAIASAKAAYEIYTETFSAERFGKLNVHRANTQRLLWASTSTKNPAYSDVKYPEALIGPQTVNTLPVSTLNAYRDHGQPYPDRLKENTRETRIVLRTLGELGIDLRKVTGELVDEGIDKFVKPFQKLKETIERRRLEAFKEHLDSQRISTASYHKAIRKRIDEMAEQHFARRMWQKDASLWSSDDKTRKMIGDSLGWMHVAEHMEEAVPALKEFAAQVKQEGFTHVVHMGMGGSSLAPLVFRNAFANESDGLELHVLDSTDPETISKLEHSIPLEKTLFIVASKSGTTTEPLCFGDYFYERVREIKHGRAGENFVAITDPHTPLVTQAEERGYRRTFLNYSDIGGRYSALSYFGMVPAVLMGIDIGELLERATRMGFACDGSVEIENNPGVSLGIAIGELANQGRDKLTFVIPDQIATLGMWLEQLIAESTGKLSKGILPVAGESVGGLEDYGDDRVFAQVRLGRTDNHDARIARLHGAGHPVITIEMQDKYDLAQEMFRWEIATAVAGHVIGINPFDQPNVQESKDNTRRLLEQFAKEGHLAEERPVIVEPPLSVFATERGDGLQQLLTHVSGNANPGDYIAIQAYVEDEPDTDRLLQQIRVDLRDRTRLATTVGYGPRFLHSTGQYHKGGPDTGIFFQITRSNSTNLSIPGHPFSFDTLIQAQAQGDLEALRKHGRRVIRIDIGDHVAKGLKQLLHAVNTSTKDSVKL